MDKKYQEPARVTIEEGDLCKLPGRLYSMSNK